MTPVTRIAAAAVLTFAATGAALAADLPARMAPAAFVAPVPVFTWTGAYFGVNAGYAFDNQEKFSGPTGNTIIGGSRLKSDGFSGGGQIGYNYQLGGFGGFGGGAGGGLVVGFEADAMYMDTNKTDNLAIAGGNTTYRSGLDFLGTARGRVGVAFNQFMVYGTGGFAYGDVDTRAVNYGPDGRTVNYIGRASGFNTGYVYGGGIEYALPTGSFLNFFHSSAVTIKAEYLRYELNSNNLKDDGANLINLNNGVKVKNEGNLARVGLNYKF